MSLDPADTSVCATAARNVAWSLSPGSSARIEMLMSTQPKTFLTPEQYLEIERAAESRSEYYNGEMFAMAGTSFRHARIIRNVMFELTQKLRGGKCEAVSSEVRLRVSPKGLYTYPDVMVVCGGPQFVDKVLDTVTNPIVIVEILSPTTEAYDRGPKFESYRTLESLRDYIMIAQDRVHVEHYMRQADGTWILQETSDREQTIEIASIGCGFKLSDAYENVAFELPSTPGACSS
jgi:Uma2 family endonuclease